jgi:hypothetical protein
MATSRRRSSGFAEKPIEEEIIETAAETVAEDQEDPNLDPFVEKSIVPSELPEVQLVEETDLILKTSPHSNPEKKTSEQQLTLLPKRHPRNIPKFSRHK